MVDFTLDSLFEVSFSQQSQPGAEKKVDTFVVLNVFNGTQIFRLFNESELYSVFFYYCQDFNLIKIT